MLQCELVPTMLVDGIFGKCAEGLGKSLAKVNSSMDVPYLYQQCRAGEAMLVVAHEGDAIGGAMVVRFERRQTGTSLCTLGLWCSQKGAYELLEQKQYELARTYGAKSLISGARASHAGHCGYLRKHPTAKILSYTLEVDLPDA